jgi:hypothetical protein
LGGLGPPRSAQKEPCGARCRFSNLLKIFGFLWGSRWFTFVTFADFGRQNVRLEGEPLFEFVYTGKRYFRHPPFTRLHSGSLEIRPWRPIIDALDTCLMVHGSWLKAHGSWPREARGGSWLMARFRPGPGDPETRFRSGSGPARLWVPRAGRHLAMGHEPPLASLGHEP